MQRFFYLGILFFIVDAIGILVNALKVSVECGRYIEAHYPTEYHKMMLENYVRNVLQIPWRKNSIQYFMWFSEDDFGDPRIAIFKKKIRWSFYGFLINGIAMMIFFIVVAVWLDH
jgi:hypothetical protein